jgi:hypothetical protein
LQELFGGLRKRDEPELLETVLGDALPANLDRVAASLASRRAASARSRASAGEMVTASVISRALPAIDSGTSIA